MNRIAVLALAALAVVRPSLAQGPNQTDMTVDAATRRQVVDGVLARLIEAYVFPDTAVAMQRAIRDRVRRGEYDRITSAQALADSLTYDLQTRKRAVIVGDTTGGGAHPGGMQRVSEHFGVWVPSGRAINPITKTNWERVGVRPDVAVASDQALRTAHLAALRGLRQHATDAERQRQLDQAIAEASRPPPAP